jgi:hypothetical protein
MYYEETLVSVRYIFFYVRYSLSVVSIIEELFQGNSGSGLETEINGRKDSLRWPCDTLYPQKLALTSPTSGGRSVGIVCLPTKTTEFCFFINGQWTKLSTHFKCTLRTHTDAGVWWCVALEWSSFSTKSACLYEILKGSVVLQVFIGYVLNEKNQPPSMFCVFLSILIFFFHLNLGLRTGLVVNRVPKHRPVKVKER